jgi:hypothetical protein
MKEEKKEVVVAIVPAVPGCLVLEWHRDDNGLYIDEHPIIAWRIEGDLAVALTPDWAVNDNWQANAIQYPDGKVVEPGLSIYPNREEWIKNLDEKAEELKKVEVK